MKILFMSDIHGIVDNLWIIDKVIEKRKIDKLVVLGDLYGIGKACNNEEVYKFLLKYRDILICMKGNCDSQIDVLNSEFPICSDLSLINTDAIDIYITHGCDYNYRMNDKFRGSGVLVYGHEHIPYIKSDKKMKYVNVGSISLPRNGTKPTYAIYENKVITIYDIFDYVVDMVKLV